MDFKSSVLSDANRAKQLLDTAKELGILDKVAEYFKQKDKASKTLTIPGLYNKYLHWLKHRNLFPSLKEFIDSLIKAQQAHGLYVVSIESLSKNYRTVVLKIITPQDWQNAFGTKSPVKGVLMFGRRFDNGGIATLHDKNLDYLAKNKELVVLPEGLATLNVQGARNKRSWESALEQKFLNIPVLNEQLASIDEKTRKRYVNLIVQNLMSYQQINKPEDLAQLTTYFGERDNLRLDELGDLIKSYDKREDVAGLLVRFLDMYSRQFNADVLSAIKEIIEVNKICIARQNILKELAGLQPPDKFIVEKAKMPRDKLLQILKAKYALTDQELAHIDIPKIAANMMRYQQELSTTFATNLSTVEDIFQTANICLAKLQDLISTDARTGQTPLFLSKTYEEILAQVGRKDPEYLAYFIVSNFVPTFMQALESGKQQDILAMFLATQKYKQAA